MVAFISVYNCAIKVIVATKNILHNFQLRCFLFDKLQYKKFLS